MFACVYAHQHVCIVWCAGIYAHTRACVSCMRMMRFAYVCMFACVHVHQYVCMFAYVHVHQYVWIVWCAGIHAQKCLYVSYLHIMTFMYVRMFACVYVDQYVYNIV